ncbi:MAG: ACT domain-containing protein, partial [Oscillospiraceae bacterium]|nr:ACT domain-containing protein [Oscillospiraceae bacterium]
MTQRPKYFIVEAEKLPEVFHKVVQVKRMLETREAETVNEAAQRVGLSRSAFYKYKDSVMPFNDMMSGHIVTFQSLLRDETGVLSSILRIFAASGANILTINQSIPVNGCAAVTVSAETSKM